jgi:hypothetical protein
VKKNKQPTLAHTPGGPGRLRSWSGPVETDFQGRPRFSSDNRPAAFDDDASDDQPDLVDSDCDAS